VLRSDPDGCHPTKLAHLRRLRGYTLRTLSDATGIDRIHLGRVETRGSTKRGKAGNVSWATAGKLAKVLAGEGATIADIDQAMKELFVIEEAAVD